MIIDSLIKNKDISNLSNFNTKAHSKYYFEINSRQDIDSIYEIYNYALKNNLKLLFVAWGTNLLFAFDIFDWIIIKNNLSWWTYNSETKILESYSNELISDISESLLNDSRQVLWKRFIWLPWSIWWAVFWNAGCFWLETENNFVEAELLDLETWKRTIIDREEMKFNYRTSIIKETNKYFIIKVKFDLSKLVEKYSSDVDNLYFREHKQPKGNTCGSFFKNPSRENSAWKLIEDVWLRWNKIWWAFFSDKHANFLMNDGTATYTDLLDLIKLAQEKVKGTYNLDLVPEVRIIFN